MILASAIIALLPARSAAQTAPGGGTAAPFPVTLPDSAETGTTDVTPGARFLAIGAGIGSPAGLTFIAGGTLAPVSLRVSGGYWGHGWNGIQGDLGIIFTSSPLFAQGISLVGGVYRASPFLPDASGTARQSDKMVHYVGAAYDAYLAGLFLQAGLAHGRGDYPDPQLLLQFGYLFTF